MPLANKIVKERALSNEKSFENYQGRQELKSSILASIFLVGSLKGPQDLTTRASKKEKIKTQTNNSAHRRSGQSCEMLFEGDHAARRPRR